jgi:hypothetical protein
MHVYDKENYKRKGVILIHADSTKPGKVRVQWYEPTSYTAWIRVTRLRDQATANLLTINYFLD